MIKNKRQQTILNILAQNEIVNVSDLTDALQCSSMTIRRDLEYFEQNEIVRRVHGGAILLKNETVLPAYEERLTKCKMEKTAIGKAAMNLIEQDAVICIDAGTTSLAMTQQMPEGAKFTAITTGVATAVSLCRHKQIEIIQVGGSIHKDSFTVCDSLAKEFIKQFNADIAFLSTRAIDLNHGTLESNLRLVDEKKALISIAKRTVILADYTKFSGTSLCKSISLSEIDCIITDSKAPAAAINKLRASGIEVIVVEPE